MDKKKVLFVCICNSARSQMAEEILRLLADDKFEVESAGLEPGNINPFVVEVLNTKGVDILYKQTQAVSDLMQEGREYDYVITVCDETSAERCPVFPGSGERLHWGFEDPSGFVGTEEEKMLRTHGVCDQIETKIKDWLAQMDVS